MGPTGDDIGVIQIHPTRHCNLRCQHCYSTSGPEQAGALPIEALERLLAEARQEGFNGLGCSGGEPLVYRPLSRLIGCAAGLGFVTSVTTNGLLLNARHIAQLKPHLSLLAISLDGVPESHDRLRALPGAFAKLRRKLAAVRAAGLRFGFIFTLTFENLDELGWVAEFAVAEGASLLQIHPLEQVGRARDYELLPPDDLELSYAFLEVARLGKLYQGRIALQFDAADRSLIACKPELAFAVPTPDAASLAGMPLAALVSPLVVEEDGVIVPVQHGFSRDFAIGRLGGDFREQAARWKRARYPAFLDLARDVWERMRDAPAHLPFTNWYSAITTGSASHGR
ncbi:MAG TPA: radical SAM protein [Polyangiaceae bacterium]